MGGAFTRGLHLVGLATFAIAQPLFDLLGRHVEFFVVHGSQGADLALLALALVALLPAVMLTLEAVAGLRSGGARDGLHGLFVALLAALIAMAPLALRAGLAAPLAIPAALALGAGFAALYRRSAGVRSFVTLGSLLGLVLPLVFVARTQAALAPAPAPAPAVARLGEHKPSVVFVVLDELPTASLMTPGGQIDAARFPNFAALGEQAHWYRNATTVVEGTMLAVPAILTGKRPQPPFESNATDPENLFNLLAPDYAMQVFEPMTRLCPPRLCPRERPLSTRLALLLRDSAVAWLHLVVPHDLRARFPQIAGTWSGFREPEGGADEPSGAHNGWDTQLRQLIGALDPESGPTLYFAHAVLPHVPWHYLPSGRHYKPRRTLPHGAESEVWSDDEWPTIQGLQRHLLQLAYVDRVLGDLIARLREVGLYDSSLLVLVADHGVSFLPGEARRSLTQSNAADMLPVPLFIKLPYQTRGGVDDRWVTTNDILPTIAAALEIQIPWRVDGRPIAGRDGPVGSFERAEFERSVPRALSVTDATRLQGSGFAEWHFGTERLEQGRLAASRRIHSLFGPGDRPDGLFRVGPHARLSERHLSSLRVLPASDAWSVELDHARDYKKLRPDRLAQVYVAGELRSSAGRPPRELVVAVDGTIWASTWTYDREDDRAQFVFMVPERSLHRGENRVEVFAVEQAAAGVALRPIPSG